MRLGGGWKSQKNFKAPNYSERLKVMTLTFWKFKGIHLCTYVFFTPQKLWQFFLKIHILKSIFPQKRHEALCILWIYF